MEIDFENHALASNVANPGSADNANIAGNASADNASSANNADTAGSYKMRETSDGTRFSLCHPSPSTPGVAALGGVGDDGVVGNVGVGNAICGTSGSIL